LNIHDVAGADHFDAAGVAAVDDERNDMKFHVCNPPEGRIYTLMLLMLLLLSSGILVVVRLPHRCHRHTLILMMMMMMSHGPEEVEEVPPIEIDDHYSFPLDFA
jgi:hypothetical protein